MVQAKSLILVAMIALNTVLSVYNGPMQSSYGEAGASGSVANSFAEGRRNHLSLEALTRNPAEGSLSCPEGLMPMYDRVVHPFAANTTGEIIARRIPRTIHASMKTRCLAPDTHDVLQGWKDALPSHSFYFHDDGAVDRLFDMPWEVFPQLSSFMRCVRFKGAMRIDVWRILIIYRYGGLYTDVDMLPDAEKFNEKGPIGPEDDAFFLSDAWNRPSQWFFAMVPGHPIAYFTMLSIFANLQKLEDIERPSVVFVTGPDALKRGYGDATWWKTDFLEGTYKCKGGKTATKLLRKHGFVNQIDMKEIVEFNDTKVTRRKRLEVLHGMRHWTDEKNTKKIEWGGTCIDYLYALDHGLQNETGLFTDKGS